MTAARRAAAIAERLSDQARAIVTVKLHDRIDSTNLELLRELAQGAPSGSVCLAGEQTAGRGRDGRLWHSPPGDNLYCSLLWRFDRSVGTLSGLSLAIGVAVCRALAELGTEAARLKWPNDIVVDQDGALRKLGGILVQAESAGEETAAVIGIGVNGSLSAGAVQRIDQPWIDLASLGGTPGWAELAATVINHCVEVVQVFAAQGLPALLSDWQRLDALSQRPIRIVIGEQSFDAVALGVEADGALRCRLADGSQRSFASGEVTLRAR